MTAPTSSQRLRRLAEARRVAASAYAHRCCVVCGGEGAALQILHLDRRDENIDVDNLAFACAAHGSMYEAGLYPAAALRLMRDHWQATRGQPVSAAVPDAALPVARTAGKQVTLRRRTRLVGRVAARS